MNPDNNIYNPYLDGYSTNTGWFIILVVLLFVLIFLFLNKDTSETNDDNAPILASTEPVNNTGGVAEYWTTGSSQPSSNQYGVDSSGQFVHKAEVLDTVPQPNTNTDGYIFRKTILFWR